MICLKISIHIIFLDTNTTYVDLSIERNQYIYIYIYIYQMEDARGVMIAFHIALIPLGKVSIQLFSHQLWVNSRTDSVLQPW